MDIAAPAQETKRTGALASLWAMLRLIMSLMLKPGGAAAATARLAECEVQVARSVLQAALDSDPDCSLTVDDFEIVRIYNASGAFDPDFALKPHVLSARRHAWRDYYLHLRHVRLARALENWIGTLTGMRQSLPRSRNRRHFGRMGRRSSRISIRARLAAPAALPALIPP